MTIKKAGRSYLVSSVISKNGSWNNSINKTPKKYEDTYFASDRAYKYAIRYLFEAKGELVLIKEWNALKEVKSKAYGKMKRIENLTDKELLEHFKKQGIEIGKDFWEFADVRQFGMVLFGIGLHGVVQVSQGIDGFKKGVEYEDDVTSRMTFDSGEKATTALNPKTHLSEAHFLYDIVVEPSKVNVLNHIEEFKDLHYSEEDYELLLEGLLHGPRIVMSTQKQNCSTGFLVQIDLKEDVKLHLNDLSDKVKIIVDENNSSTYDIENLVDYLLSASKGDTSVFENILIKYAKHMVSIKDLDAAKAKLPTLRIEEI